MTKYELMLIIDPKLSESERDDVLKTIKSDVSVLGKIEKEDIWGEKRMAYKINKSQVGFYALFYINGDGTKITEVTQVFNLNKNIWRSMFVKLED